MGASFSSLSKGLSEAHTALSICGWVRWLALVRTPATRSLRTSGTCSSSSTMLSASRPDAEVGEVTVNDCRVSP